MITGKKKPEPTATLAQLDYVVKLKISTGDEEKIPIPLTMTKAGEMIKRLQLKRSEQRYWNRRDRQPDYDSDWGDACRESSWSDYMWGGS